MNTASRRRVKVIVNGKPYVVEVGDLASSPISVTVNGQPYVVDIETGEAETAPVSAPAAALEAVARETLAPPTAALPAGPAGPKLKELRAPMPGDIVDIAVKSGDRVAFGQQLCALEAMKMRSAIRSPRDGIVASVDVAPGQAVAYGDVLMTFD